MGEISFASPPGQVVLVMNALGTWMGVFVGVVSLGVMLWIAWRQSKQMAGHEKLVRELDTKVLGNLASVEDVVECMVRLLKESEREESAAYLMCYWIWFGADLVFPRKTQQIGDVDRNASDVAKLLWARLAKQLRTTVVVYEPTAARRELCHFMEAVLKYNAWDARHEGHHATADVQQGDVNKLVDRYTKDYEKFDEDCRDGSAVELRGIEQVAAIMLAKEGEQPGAVVFMLETDALEGRATGGGFLSRDRRMVKVVTSQIVAAAKRRTL